MKKKLMYLLPLFLVEAVFFISILLYRFGPWMFPYRKDNQLFIFIISCNIAFALGYCILLIKEKSNLFHNVTDDFWNTKFNLIFIKIFLIINIVVFIPYCYFRTGTIYPNIITAINDLSVAYANSTAMVINNSGIIPKIFTSIGSLLTFFTPLYVYAYWSKMKVFSRCAFSFLSIWYFLINVCSGRNKAIFVTAIMFVITFFILWINNYINGLTRHQIITIIIKGAIALASVLISIAYFGLSMEARANNTEAQMTSEKVSVADIYDQVITDSDLKVEKPTIVNEPTRSDDSVIIEPGKIAKYIIDNYNAEASKLEKVYPYYVSPLTYAYFDVQHPLVKRMPDSLKHFFASGSYYLTHGYHGLSIAMRTKFDFTYGFGQVPLLQGIVGKVFNVNIYERTYISKVSKAGYPIYLNWGTAYLLFASDVTFVGVVFLMGIFGLLISALWLELLKAIDFISLILFISLMYNLLLITSWWQAGMSGTDFIMFYGCLLLWIIRKIILLRKKKIKNIVE